MKSLWLTLLMIHCSFTAVFPQTGWNALNSGTDINLSRIQFVNSQTGWAGGFQRPCGASERIHLFRQQPDHPDDRQRRSAGGVF